MLHTKILEVKFLKKNLNKLLAKCIIQYFMFNLYLFLEIFIPKCSLKYKNRYTEHYCVWSLAGECRGVSSSMSFECKSLHAWSAVCIALLLHDSSVCFADAWQSLTQFNKHLNYILNVINYDIYIYIYTML